MGQPDLAARLGMFADVSNIPTEVLIPGTRRTVKVRGIKPYTIECLTKLWLEREVAQSDKAAGVLKSLCVEPYFAVREACLLVLNGYFRIKFLYPLMWRIWGKWRGYTDEQMEPIIAEGKKKLPLTAHWRIMASTVDMRMDWMKMTNEEAEQYRAELLSVAKRLSSKNSQSTDGRSGE